MRRFIPKFDFTRSLIAIRTLIEKTEYNIPIHMSCVDFQKAFDETEMCKILKFTNCIESRYTLLIANIYINAPLRHILFEQGLVWQRKPLEYQCFCRS